MSLVSRYQAVNHTFNGFHLSRRELIQIADNIVNGSIFRILRKPFAGYQIFNRNTERFCNFYARFNIRQPPSRINI